MKDCGQEGSKLIFRKKFFYQKWDKSHIVYFTASLMKNSLIDDWFSRCGFHGGVIDLPVFSKCSSNGQRSIKISPPGSGRWKKKMMIWLRKKTTLELEILRRLPQPHHWGYLPLLFLNIMFDCFSATYGEVNSTVERFLTIFIADKLYPTNMFLWPFCNKSSYLLHFLQKGNGRYLGSNREI